MKVKELILILQKCDPEKEVVCYDADNIETKLVRVTGIKNKEKIEVETNQSI